MRLFLSAIDRLSLLLGMIAAALIATGILLVCQMVFIRYVLNGSTAWQTDAVIFCLAGATLIGSPFVLRERGHVTVDLVTGMAGPRARRVMAILADGVVLVFALVLLWKGIELTVQAWQGDWRTETIAEFPLWMPYLSLPVGFGALALQALAGMIQSFVGIAPEAARGQ